MKPIFPAVGGKRHLADFIYEVLLENDVRNLDSLISPFLGGGSVELTLLDRMRFKEVWLSDSNVWLAREWGHILVDPEEVYRYLDIFNSMPNPQAMALARRAVADRLPFPGLYTWVVHNSFSTLWRVNSQGQLNAAVKSKGIKTPDLLELKNFSCFLKEKNVSIAHADFRYTLDLATSFGMNTGLVFLDPPYVNTYDQYTAEGWCREYTRELARYITSLVALEFTVLLTETTSVLPFLEETPPYIWWEIPKKHRLNGASTEAHKEVVVLWRP